MCKRILSDDKAQTFIIFALLLSVLVLFAGLSLDAGILYMTKARLSKAVDGGCLAGMKTLSLGQSTAATIASNVFKANFGAAPPTPTVTFPVDASNNQQVKVTATVSVHTFFMQFIPRWATVPVSATAVSTRGKLIMSLVLDRSGSMCGGTNSCDSGVTGDKGGEALQSAVPTFVNNFDDANDEVAMISFASGSSSDVSMRFNFKSPISTAVGNMDFTGGTFGTGRGTRALLNNTYGAPLSLAKFQNDSVSIPSGQNVVKVVVYFTDGLMNTIQDNFSCPSTVLLNYGGHDSGSQVDIFIPSTGVDVGHYVSGTGFPYDSSGHICKTSSGALVTKFPSQKTGTDLTFAQSDVTADAQYRARQTATELRTQSPIPTYIFTIGLGSGVTTTTQAFLAELANDPNYPATYNSSQPDGLFQYVPNCPSTTCSAALQKAFQTIAAKVLLRLTE